MHQRILTLVLTIVALVAGQSAWAQTFTVTSSTSGTTTTFTVTRSGSSLPAQTVNYRTVSLSAFAGQHYTAVSGSLDFAANATSKTVTVTEKTPTDGYLYYSGSTTRTYRFEVLDTDGFELAHLDRSRTVGTSISATNIFSEKSVTVFTTEQLVTDKGYGAGSGGNNYHAAPIANYFSAAAPQAYLQLISAQLRLLVELEAKESVDGYQHIQILVNQTTKYDPAGDADAPGTINYSHYLGCFSHDQNGLNTTYAKPPQSPRGGRKAAKIGQC